MSGYYHERHENGTIYMYSDEHPDIPLCSGAGGTCRTPLDPEKHGSLCPSCEARKNLRNTEIPEEIEA